MPDDIEFDVETIKELTETKGNFEYLIKDISASKYNHVSIYVNLDSLWIHHDRHKQKN